VIDTIKKALEEQMGAYRTDLDTISKMLKDAPPAQVKADLEALVAKQERRIDELEAKKQLLPADSKRSDEWAVKAMQDLGLADSKRGIGSMPSTGGAKVPSVLKAAVLDSTELGVGGYAHRAGVVGFAQRRPRMIDLLPQVELGEAESYTYDKETSRSANSGAHGFVDQSGGAGSGDSSIVLDDVSGLRAGQVVRFHLVGSTVEKTIQSITEATRTVTFTATFGGSGIADATRWTVYRDFAATDEGDSKPSTLVETEAVSLTVQMIAVYLRTTEQRLRRAAARDLILSRLPARVRRVMNRQALYGTGLTGTIHGLLTDSDAETVTWSEMALGSTMGDCLYKAGVDCISDGEIVGLVHPNDWFKIMSAKSAAGGYLHGRDSVMVALDTPTLRALGRFPVELDDDLNEGDGWIGAPAEAGEIVRQAESTLAVGQVAPGVRMGYLDDDFARNRCALRSEEACELAVLSTGAYRIVDFDEAPSA